MRPKELKETLKVLIEKGSGPEQEICSLFIGGPPGIGKSRIVEDTAKECKVDMRDIRLLLCDPSDLRGIPVPITNGDGKPTARWIPPDDLPTSGRGVLFFDDFLTAPPLVQGSAYQLTIRPHQLGNYQLPTGWVVVAASNRVADRALVHRMPTALANRFIHIELEENIDDWSNWALAQQPSMEPNIIAFLRWRPELLFKFDADSAERAFPSPRSWEFTSRILQSFGKRLIPELMIGTVGKGAAAEFLSFLKVQTELPDLNSIFKGSNEVPTKVSLKYALCSALAVRAKPAQFERLIQYSFFLPQEFSVLLVKMLLSKDKTNIYTCPSIKKWTAENQDVIL